MDIYHMLRLTKSATAEEVQQRYSRVTESYRLVAACAEDEDVAKLANAKLSAMRSEGLKMGLEEDKIETAFEASEQTELSAIRRLLNSSNGNATILNGSNIDGKLNQLPDSGEKYYLKAIVTLKTDSSLKGCEKAVEYLRKALTYDPSNSAYLGIMDAIAEEIAIYEDEQRRIAESSEQERKQREKQSLQTVHQAQRRRFWGSAGGCIGGLVGLGVLVGGGICLYNICKSTLHC